MTKRKNARQPSRRVRKALKKYVKKELAGIPTQYTPAQVRVDSKGELNIKFARPPAGKKKNPRGFSVKARLGEYRHQRKGGSGVGKSIRAALSSKNGKKRTRKK